MGEEVGTDVGIRVGFSDGTIVGIDVGEGVRAHVTTIASVFKVPEHGSPKTEFDAKTLQLVCPKQLEDTVENELLDEHQDIENDGH